jgi:hypothetical protein
MTPTATVMPTPGKSLDVFAIEQTACKQFAEQQIAPARNQANNQVLATALTTQADDPLSVVQTKAGEVTSVLQQQYDIAYAQCMYAKGNQVPGYAAAPIRPEHRRRVRPRKPTEAPVAQSSSDKFIEPASRTQPSTEPFKEPPVAR